jgi:hypothetical protein
MFHEILEEIGEWNGLFDEGTEAEECLQFLAIVTHTKTSLREFATCIGGLRTPRFRTRCIRKEQLAPLSMPWFAS